MLAFSKYNSICLIFFSFFAYAEYDLNDNHTADKKHGLWEVRACAVDFLYNEEKNIIYRDAMEPNLKIFVPRCVVPLRAIWTPKSKEQRAPRIYYFGYL